jgi:hypothetical protein
MNDDVVYQNLENLDPLINNQSISNLYKHHLMNTDRIEIQMHLNIISLYIDHS